MTIKSDALFARKYNELFRMVMGHEFTEYTLTGGRGSCKSSFISLCVVILIVMFPQFNALIIRKNANTLRTSVYEQIQKIEQQSKMLNDANDMISSIADQTSLLAMNAAIEAAHAGDAGKVKDASDDVDNAREEITGDVETLRMSSESVRASLDNMEKSVKVIEEGDDSLMNIATSISGSIYCINSQIEQFKI